VERTDILRELVARGTDTDPARCVELAAELDMLASDLFVVAGHPVPADLLPPERDPQVMKEFAYRATFCNHAQMAALEEFVHSLPHLDPEPLLSPVAPRRVYAQPDAGPSPRVLDGLMRNRGFGIKELPFTGLSMSTIYHALTHDRHSEHRWYRLSNLAGPLGWKFLDLLAVAGEPTSDRPRSVTHCHHLGRVFVAAVRLTTDQLIEAAEHADRLSLRPDQGAWRPVSYGFATECPDPT
jgi:hypothetical protein